MKNSWNRLSSGSIQVPSSAANRRMGATWCNRKHAPPSLKLAGSPLASNYKCLASSNKCLTSSNKKLVITIKLGHFCFFPKTPSPMVEHGEHQDHAVCAPRTSAPKPFPAFAFLQFPARSFKGGPCTLSPSCRLCREPKTTHVKTSYTKARRSPGRSSL